MSFPELMIIALLFFLLLHYFKTILALMHDPSRDTRLVDLFKHVNRSLRQREAMLFFHLPSISPCEDSCCSSAILIQLFFRRPLHSMYTSGSCHSLVAHARRGFKMLRLNRFAVSLRYFQKLSKPVRCHHTSLTS